ncbi:MAG: hypothetical protein SGCHY_005376, partial [Lobulomycetales sp.]
MQAVEAACFRIFNASSPAEHSDAQSFLDSNVPTVESSSPDRAVEASLALLNQSTQVHTLMFALLRLQEIVTGHWSSLSPAFKAQLRSNALGALASPDVSYAVSSGLAQLLCIIAKTSWLDDPEAADLLPDINQLLSSDPTRQLRGLQLMALLVTEMNLPRSNLALLSRHRKIAVSFRDSALFPMFSTALAFLRSLLEEKSGSLPSDQSTKLQECTLVVLRNCLGFDFIGTIPDDSSDDIGTIQIPSSWKSLICEFSTIKLFFDGFKSCESEIASNYMECLGLIVSTRRSIFSNDTDRGKFLAWILEATTDILSSPQQLCSTPETILEFSRLLNRLKSVNQLAELIEKDRYDSWVELVLGFTLKLFETSLANPDTNLSGGTPVLYLLTFWSKMSLSVSSNTSSRPKAHDRLEEISGILSSTFIQSRVTACRSPNGVADEDIPFALGDADQENEWISCVELIASISRLAYVSTCSLVGQVFDSLATGYQERAVA